MSTVHTNSAAGAITRLRDMGIESFLLASSLKTIISQRLIRRICNRCKSESKVSQIAIELLGLKKDETVFEANGCNQCEGSGFRGRIAIAESIQISSHLKDMIHDEASEQDIQNYALKGTQSIDQIGSELLTKGLTSPEELIRINNQKENASI
tara:strand:- start:365 stop:823 length:459 start_codon:yes stop_codon:yes gene_type:complete